MAYVTKNVTKKMRTDISRKINRLPLSYLDKNSYGDVLSRVTNDVDTVAQTMNTGFTSIVSSVTLFFGSMIMMFATNWILAIAGILAASLGFVAMSIVIAKSQKYFVQQQRSLGDIDGHIEEIYTGHIVVKTYNATEQVTQKFDEMNNELYHNSKKAQFLSSIMGSVMGVTADFSYVVVCFVGALLAINGIIPFETIIAFMIYIRLFTQPLSQIGEAMSTFQSTSAATQRIDEFLHEKEMADEKDKTQVLTDIKGNVEFRNVQFGYNDDKLVIKNFNAKIKAGQKVAIVGPTGAGKTTIVNLLMRFYEVTDGDILIDDVNTKDLTRQNVHDLFGMVLQDTWLFNGTIKENIRYSKQNVTDEEIQNACIAVGVDHFIRTLPNGYDTILDDSTSISAGQKQLLTIARAMVQNSPMLILDEATSSVDTRTEILIQKAMDKLTKGRTSFVIAHRLSTIRNADMILVMKDGDIIEQGNHKTLLAQKGFYADLYNSQFEPEDE